MVDFLTKLPAPTRTSIHTSLVAADASLASYSLVSKSEEPTHATRQTALVKKSSRAIPLYGSRYRWIPRCLEDFADGGAYPEIHVAQFPHEMGRSSTTSTQSVVPLQTGEDGRLAYDAVIKQGLSHRSAIYTRPTDLKPKWSAVADLQKPTEEESEEVQKKTKAALDAALAKKMAIGIPKNVNKEPEYIKYTPSQQTPGHNSNCAQRIIRMVEAQIDPMEPPKHRHRRVPAGPSTPPPAILHSPPRKLTAKDQAEWRIPPCVSNWKNQKGYTIPLDKRLAADGRSLQDVSINDKFASLSEALYIAERSAREQIRTRNELVKQKKQQEENVREQQLRELAAKARQERTALVNRESLSKTEQLNGDGESADHEYDDEGARKRAQIERDRRRKVERELRLERAGKKRTRDEDRDISERIALGQAKPTSQEGLFDSRLFNQTAGMDSGFSGGSDDRYDVYDKPLFADRSKQNLYRIDQDRMEQNVGSIDRMPAFSGADTERQRTAPVEFEKDVEDPFGLESLMEASKKQRRS